MLNITINNFVHLTTWLMMDKIVKNPSLSIANRCILFGSHISTAIVTAGCSKHQCLHHNLLCDCQQMQQLKEGKIPIMSRLCYLWSHILTLTKMIQYLRWLISYYFQMLALFTTFGFSI